MAFEVSKFLRLCEWQLIESSSVGLHFDGGESFGKDIRVAVLQMLSWLSGMVVKQRGEERAHAAYQPKQVIPLTKHSVSDQTSASTEDWEKQGLIKSVEFLWLSASWARSSDWILSPKNLIYFLNFRCLDVSELLSQLKSIHFLIPVTKLHRVLPISQWIGVDCTDARGKAYLILLKSWEGLSCWLVPVVE